MDFVSHCLLGKKVLGYTQFKGLLNFEYSEQSDKLDPVVPNDVDKILQVIYKANPVSGLPEGDLAMFDNEEVSPEVRDYIRRNLMGEIGSDGDSSGFDGLSDDDIAGLTRDRYESRSEYRGRVYDYLKVQRSHAAFEAQSSKDESRLESRGRVYDDDQKAKSSKDKF